VAIGTLRLCVIDYLVDVGRRLKAAASCWIAHFSFFGSRWRSEEPASTGHGA
jgi:hypothetical protein